MKVRTSICQGSCILACMGDNTVASRESKLIGFVGAVVELSLNSVATIKFLGTS